MVDMNIRGWAVTGPLAAQLVKLVIQTASASTAFSTVLGQLLKFAVNNCSFSTVRSGARSCFDYHDFGKETSHMCRVL